MVNANWKGVVLSVLIFMGVFSLLKADDKELFIGKGLSTVKPNVMILMDSSGSMNTIIFYPKVGIDGLDGTADDGYDPRINYEGTLDDFGAEVDNYWTTSETRWRARWVLDNHGYSDNSWTGIYNKENDDKILCGSTGQGNLEVGDWIINRKGSAIARIKSKTDCDPVIGTCGSWLELEDRQGTFELGQEGDDNCIEVRSDGSVCRPVYMYGNLDGYNPVRYDRNYLKWLFLHSSEEQRFAVSHFSTYGTFDVTDFHMGTPSDCITPGHEDRIQQVFTRIQVAREVACKVATDALFIVNLGLYIFNGSDGGSQVETLMDLSEEASFLVDYKNKIYGVAASSWTPLAEALADIWLYYRPGGNEMHYWPVNMDSYVKPSPKIEHWCQQHFAVVMTDGESTYDEFTGTKYDDSIFSQYPVSRAESWSGWADGWGDPDFNDKYDGMPENYNPETSYYCPNWTCWKRLQPNGSNWYGTDYLDDVAYFMSHSDLFPEKNQDGTIDLYTNFPGQQRIFTYTIGFVADNDLLRATAINGDGAYYTANNYEELVEAFKRIFTSILLRNFGFSAITAPKKTASALSDDLSISYVGYFLPSMSASIWEGHLLAYELVDRWGFDIDGNGEMDISEYIYDTEDLCLDNSDNRTCMRFLDLKAEHQWDAADKIPEERNLYTHYNSPTAIPFNLTNITTLQSYFGGGTSYTEAQMILEKIGEPKLADVFHSDVVFVGPPHLGKNYLPYTNSLDPGAEPYLSFYNAHTQRRRVLFAGTNDGILHMFYADDPETETYSQAGAEVWGFIPDEVLPTMKDIVIEGEYNYTVDGRITAQDLYFSKASQEPPTWTTALCFGLRSGGNAYYQLDVTNVTNEPVVMWKFKDADYSGESWGKPIYGRIKLADPLDPTLLIDRWVVILAGGFAYNYENPNDLKGKAIFMVDAGTGELLWMTGYHPQGETNSDANTWIDTSSSDSIRHLTADPLFNYPVPSSIIAVDKEQDGYLDAIYFANTGGHFFRADIYGLSMSQWHTYNILEIEIETTASSQITTIQGDDITIAAAVFQKGQTILGQTSYAMGQITAISDKILTINPLSGTFVAGETLLKRSYDPVFISPAVAYDACSNLWISFGTGDRDRPRTNPDAGKFVAFKDPGTASYQLDSLTHLTWSGDNLSLSEETTIGQGWYFNFYQDPASEIHEILFDPEPVILPDRYMVPHIYLNTYTSPPEIEVEDDDPCDAPSEGTMTIYDISLFNCGEDVEGFREDGRIAGGGMYKGKEYVMYVGKGGVASVPPLEDTPSITLPYPGGILFWKERR